MKNLDELKANLAEIEAKISGLTAEKAMLEAELQALERQQATEALNKIVGELKALNIDPIEIAKALGVTAATISQKKPRAARGTAEPKVKGVPKYRNPVDFSQTWTGKGRKPAWVVTYLENGGPLEKLLIPE